MDEKARSNRPLVTPEMLEAGAQEACVIADEDHHWEKIKRVVGAIYLAMERARAVTASHLGSDTEGHRSV